jgi:hypothetical protein
MTTRPSKRELKTKLKDLVQGLCEDPALRADFALLFVAQRDSCHYHPPIWHGELRDPPSAEDPNLRACFDRITARVVRDGRPIYAPDIRACVELDRPFAYREGVRSAACVPVSGPGKGVVGLLFVDFRKPRDFPPPLRDRIEETARAAGRAIARHPDDPLFLPPKSGAASQDSRANHQDVALDEVISLACDLTNCAVVIWLIEDGGQRRLSRHVGLSKRYRDHAKSLPGDRGLVDRAQGCALRSGRRDSSQCLPGP